MVTFLVVTAVIGIIMAIAAECGNRKFRTPRLVASFLSLGVFATVAGIDIHKSQSQKPSASERKKIEFDKTRRFQDKFLPGGGVTRIYSHERILMLEITDELAYGFLGDRLLTERILRRWLDGWEEISGYESGHITVKLDGIDLITVKHAFFSSDKVVEFHR